MSPNETDPTAFIRLRSNAGLSIPQLGERAGVGRNTIWRIESGKTTPRQATVRRIASALQVPVAAFYVDHDPTH